MKYQQDALTRPRTKGRLLPQMRLDWLKVSKFKNLTDFEIDFDEGELSTVLIGQNGTGKSNVIEALVTIFRDLDLGKPTEFRYAMAYKCHGRTVEIDNRLVRKKQTIKVDGKSLSKKAFSEGKSEFLPDNVFGYYSGTSRRLEKLFDTHQARYYQHVISPASQSSDVEEIDLRRLFYCRSTYGQLALLTYFARGSDSARAFLKQQLRIDGFDSALIVLRKPRWATSTPTKHQLEHGDPRFWHAAGLVRSLLDQLWAHSLAPFEYSAEEQDDYRTTSSKEDQSYIYIRDEKSLRDIANHFGSEKAFFALLETLDISDLVREVRIWVRRDDVDGEIPFHEISDGEKQLLSVLGLMRFTGRDESLFLLDEPDTHLNPAWKWDYLPLVREVAQGNRESHIIMTSHDPLTMGGLKASQVQVMYRDDSDKLVARPPDVEPRGLGFTSILTQIFGLPTTVDPNTQEKLDTRNALIRLENRSKAQEKELVELSSELKRLGFIIEDREPEYALFLRALEEVKKDTRSALTPDQILAQNEAAKVMLEKIMAKDEANK
ncbi:AAA family ATPase [Cognatiyoonia sp. IB215446]|uniref:AAA family ATPase n=1 Tax=Cognatiyoonia sp. IB215446 TaxID=3097355 RepID=UPI002A0C0516|nr:AAA family ATPase [Cognatiyoonia sp. IB215446]MDX8347805.1 AAA family ATPase [Cognatiyoonia sp. IB215446]